MLFGSAAVVLVLGSLVPQNELNDQFVDYFDQTITFRQDADFANERVDLWTHETDEERTYELHGTHFDVELRDRAGRAYRLSPRLDGANLFLSIGCD